MPSKSATSRLFRSSSEPHDTFRERYRQLRRFDSDGRRRTSFADRRKPRAHFLASPGVSTFRLGGASSAVVSVLSITIAGMDTATDEDHWVVPPRWWGTVLPIRGLGPAPRERVSADAAARAARTYDDAREFIDSALDNPDSDPALVGHGHAALAGAPDVLGHAVIATLVGATSDFPATGDLLDLWVTRFGVAGAAQVVASMTQLGVARSIPSDG